MGIRESSDFDTKLSQLQNLANLRGDPRTDIDQKYQTLDSIIDRIDNFRSIHLLEGHRVLTIGDADLTGLAVAIFGEPQEVVVADIDDRMSEIYFEASLDYDLPVRYLYHDMRIKIIAILKKQYSLVLVEPPRTKPGITLFLSRALEILEPGNQNKLVFTLPSNDEELISYFHHEIGHYNITIEHKFDKVNHYDDHTPADDYILNVPNDVELQFTDHHLDPLYEHEVILNPLEYKCRCERLILVGEGGEYSTLDELKSKGCSSCGSNGPFVFNSKIERL